MVMKKKLESEAHVVIAGGDQSKMFPPGYRYKMGDTIYKVLKRKFADNTEMREIVDDRGSCTFMTVESIKKDHDPAFNHGDFEVLDPVRGPDVMNDK